MTALHAPVSTRFDAVSHNFLAWLIISLAAVLHSNNLKHAAVVLNGCSYFDASLSSTGTQGDSGTGFRSDFELLTSTEVSIMLNFVCSKSLQ